MTDDGDRPARDPEAAFVLLADETRVRIVTELAEAWSEDWPGVVGYADLMDRVGATDSGRFNYHLTKLVGWYVERTDEGYAVTYDGLRVYRAIVAGTFTERPSVGPFDLDQDCHVCEGRMRARYDEDVFVVGCPDCDTRFAETSLPPRGLAGRSNEAVLGAVHQRSRHRVAQAVAGVCPWCAGRMTGALQAADEGAEAAATTVAVAYDCEACGGALWTSVGERLLPEADVIAFCERHGVDVTERPVWTLPFAATDHHTTVLARDPWRVAVDVTAGDASRRVTVDGEAAVVGVD